MSDAVHGEAARVFRDVEGMVRVEPAKAKETGHRAVGGYAILDLADLALGQIPMAHVHAGIPYDLDILKEARHQIEPTLFVMRQWW
jgi:hypothetical protein